MSKEIAERISDSFAGDGKIAEAKDYASNVYSSWKDVSNTLTRSTILILVLMAFFELLAYQHQNSNISFGGVTTTNVPVVQIVLPAVIALIIYDCIRLTGRYRDFERAYNALVHIYAPAQTENDLDLFIKPTVPAFWIAGRWTADEFISPAEKFIRGVNLALASVVVLLFPLAFEGQAYFRLFQKFGYQNVLLWVSLAVTVTFTVCAFVYIVMKGNED